MCGDGGANLFHVGGTHGSLKLDITTSSLAVSVGGKVNSREAHLKVRVWVPGGLRIAVEVLGHSQR